MVGVLSLQIMDGSAQCSGSNGSIVDVYLYGDDLPTNALLDPQASDSYKTSCESLDAALILAQNQTALSNISGFFIGLSSRGGNFIHILNGGYRFSNLSLVAVAATGSDYGAALVQCKYEAGLAIEGVDLVQIQLVNWTECGPINVAETTEGGAMFLSDVSSLKMYKSNFLESPGSAIIVQMNAKNDYNYTISHCSFETNGKMAKQMNTNGGAISLHLEQHTEASINFSNTDFLGNMAVRGGAVSINRNGMEIDVLCTFRHTHFYSCNFVANEAEIDGGAVFFIGEDAVFHNCTFMSNMAGNVGGAVYQYLYTLVEACDEERITYQSCFWMDNRAKGSAAIFLGTVAKLHHVAVLFKSNTFSRNMVLQFSFFGVSSCVLFVSDLSIQLEDVTFESNHGTALCLDSTQVEMKGHNLFDLNEGFEGGAMNIYQSSYIIPFPNTKINFYHNLAIYGGAIYHREELTGKPYCVFNFKEYNSSDSVSITFANNTAYTSGMSIYFVVPVNVCAHELDLPQIMFVPENVAKASSSAQNINFKSPVYTDSDGMLQLDVILGQQILLNASIIDYFGQPTTVLVNVFISVPNTIDHSTPPYKLQGATAFTMKSGNNYPNISIAGPDPITYYNKTTDFVLQVVGADTTEEIYLNFLPCPLGFSYDMTQQVCQCMPLDDLICDLADESVCIREGYWFGELGGTETTAICSSGFCRNVFGECNICSINGFEEFCQISEGMLVNQCIGNRSGALCAECDANNSFAFTFGAVKCVLDDTCKPVNTFLLVAINFSFMLIMIVIFLIILKLGYNISSGYMFSIIYYFSIISHLLPLNIVGETVLILLSVFRGVTQLNSQFIGYIPWCFSQNFTPLQLYALFYINPFMIGLFVFAFLILSKYCRHYVRFSDSTPIRAMCLLMLCSFATLTETSFAIIMPTVFKGVSNVYVNIQPSTSYLDPKEHLAWFLIASLVMIILIIPVTLLLLLAPCMSRLANLTRIKPFLDEFQSCYKDKYRWMASYYFICRFLYLSILTSAAAGLESTQYTIQVISLGVLVVHTLLQPYRKQVLNSVDTIILADITAITLLYGESANQLFQPRPHLRRVLTALLISIPILYLVCGTFVAFARRYGLRKKIRKWLRRHSTQGKYLYKLSERLNDPLLEDQLQTELSQSDEKNRPRSVSTLSNSIRFREPYFRYLGYEDSDEEEEENDSKHSNEECNAEQRSSNSSGSLPQPTSTVVTLERQSSSRYRHGKVSTPLRNSGNSSNNSSSDGRHSNQEWLVQTTPAEDPEL